jgi:hypothetical protein
MFFLITSGKKSGSWGSSSKLVQDVGLEMDADASAMEVEKSPYPL